MQEVTQYRREVANGVQLSDTAKAHFLRGLDRNKACTGVRISLKKAGCSGLAYVVNFVESPEQDDVIFPLDESFFIYIEHASYPLLNGISVDYVQQGLSHKLIFKNPNQTGQCGCGESFTVKIDK